MIILEDRICPGDINRRKHLKKILGITAIFIVFILYSLQDVFLPKNNIPNELPSDDSKLLQVASIDPKEELLKLGLSIKDPVKIFDPRIGKERLLYGRFLHITDIHPDRLYKEGSSIDYVCHGKEPSKKRDYAPKFGKAMAGCDSPVDLMDHTLRWIGEHLKDKIDFVIWTGDNIRHDNDRKNPRTEFQIFEMNEIVAGKFQALFGNQNTEDPRDFDVDIIPSLGNNDVFPHNLFAMGPTLQTRELYRIWSNFVPQEQKRIFSRSASFLTEVIPGKLAVLSINTLYLFKANPLVDNCNSRKQPGYQSLIWLGYILDEIRARGMKVWLSGHVPPIEKNFDSSCFHKFTLWTYEYRDIIIGGLYGHMNMDHFIPVDGKKARKALTRQVEESHKFGQDEEDQFDELFLQSADAASEVHLMGASPVGKETYMKSVRKTIYQKIHDKLEEIVDNIEIGKKRKKKKTTKPKTLDELSERYSIVNIGGSIVPTFNPGFRVWEYNITGLEQGTQIQQFKPWNEFFEDLEKKLQTEFLDEVAIEGVESNKVRRPDKTIPKKKPESIPLGPAYEPQLFSPTKFVQYFADLKEINDEYYGKTDSGNDNSKAAKEAFKFQVEYTSEDKPYPMESLLVKDFLKLASDLTQDNKLWEIFKERAFISSGYDEDKNG
ncbi:endopolyphosphatase NDAI_0H01830 [Naumovozyma dairenensis CBS 421]|uniref:Endopolyphosphatase n=1 Tax=Naumovozyma dairenensis (strain ATCC 10597 / BCRC 20456 / CBS 421 / NBRC 0211 / NRRL Y-12639) TaxID=1071378 RepID=G0WEZ6_NAUDC|nr:hypothetical protein NDAI_0H01830 [Naumovozyma dairenensis CBS 421]CCD26357.1 hypothetical protein NDAI_0H01830 [Naumovozyma dairenensis CBS 421]